MNIITMSSRQFIKHTIGALKAATNGAVFIADRGRTTHVLLTIEAYKQLIGTQTSIVDMLAMPGLAEIEFDAPRLTHVLHQTPDIS